MIEKIVLFLMAGIFMSAAQSMALSPVNLNGVTVKNGKTENVQNVYFDYEEGVWVGAPLGSEKYSDIDKNAVLTSPDGKKIVIIDHLPYLDDNGRKISLAN